MEEILKSWIAMLRGWKSSGEGFSKDKESVLETRCGLWKTLQVLRVEEAVDAADNTYLKGTQEAYIVCCTL